MKQKSKMRKGVAMMWATLVVLMVSLLSAGILMISRIYYMREQNANLSMQAQIYAESAIDIIQKEIVSGSENFVSTTNNTNTAQVTFPDLPNWDCTVTISHSVVNESKPAYSGIIYLTSNVSRTSSSGEVIQMAEVCAKLSYDDNANSWVFDGYYNL